MSDRKRGGPFGSFAARFWTVVAGVIALIGFFGFGPASVSSCAAGALRGSFVAPDGAPPADGHGGTALPQVLVGSWSGGGQQYAYDNFYQSVQVTFTAEGRYTMVIGGVLHDEGSVAVNGQYLVFRSSQGQPYTWGWGITTSSGRPVLNLLNSGGGTYSLDKV